MSATLKMAPVAPKLGTSLDDDLRFLLSSKFGLEAYPMTFQTEDVRWFQGLADAGIKGAKEVIEAIEKHDAVSLWLEY